MEFNLENIGRNIAKIEGGKFNNKIISIADKNDSDVKKSFKKLDLMDNCVFQQIPDKDKERMCLFITGPSGSGKSTYTSKYLKQYKTLYKNNPIYVFSHLKEDEVLDVFNPKRIKIGDNLLSSPLNVEMFKNSLCIFDDIDVISNKKYQDAVYSILNEILQTGRHFCTSCIFTNHTPTAGNKTKQILNEAHSISYFPHSGSLRGYKYLLMEYLGLDKEKIKKIKKTKSRWCTIFKNYPQIIMTERSISLMDDDSETETENESESKHISKKKTKK